MVEEEALEVWMGVLEEARGAVMEDVSAVSQAVQAVVLRRSLVRALSVVYPRSAPSPSLAAAAAAGRARGPA